ncbi:SDR family NAD(P)-dependent oxidoreductase [Kineosporia rhizophila]|uniref:type I polyketide synthase n=1 Tax=Kineosporia rhizophila TaxID=84633 RepID=UPI001E55CB05|nr:type I polyketide synthase [Kineosporia rhizophila]MCE0537504.1 SDR family NAD(P)-dependent oxidoreductase [Kineosporia rhizophila]
MTKPEDKVLDALRASVKETDRLRRRNRQLTEQVEATWEPIAIVGMGCRFPGGVRNPEQLWDLVSGGGDAISPFPTDRGWEAVVAAAGTNYVQTGGFVEEAPQFDPAFFGISPREALAMDPQQRMLLEVTWETLEQAGIDPAALKGSRTGVFAGGTNSGYGFSVAGTEGTEGYMLTGGLTAVISGRIAYTLGLEGPAVTVDTACSSALVALHLACQALRAQECSMALAGAVTVLATPDSFADFAQQGGLAADGRCKAFSGSADGIGWSEGAGMFLLEKLSDARRNGHPVLAVISGSAVNQDGASNGLSAPNGPSQQRVIRAALDSARLSPADVDVVEAHGTGTVLGDPIEAQAILSTYGRDRAAEKPLWLGSVKSNLGHTGAAAGAAGLMKMVLALRHGQMPRTLHVDEPTPRVDWSVGEVELLTDARSWDPEAEHVRRAGVSAFGISGTNAHLIVEEAPAEIPAEATDTDEPLPVLSSTVPAWLVSGRTEPALADQAGRLAGFLAERPEIGAADVARTLATARSHFEHRAVVTGDLAAGLSALAEGADAANVLRGNVPVGGDTGRTVFVFPGQGGQWVGMGREMLLTSPVFAARMDECRAALAPHVDWDLFEVLGDEEQLSRLDVVHPALWAVMVSLAAVWEAAGVTPDAVLGHSQGEIAAACVAGVLSLEDGARVVARRGQVMKAGLAGKGGVLSIAATLEDVQARLSRGSFEGVAVAVLNGPNATVVSGPVASLQALAEECERDGVRARFVPMDYAPHGPQVESIRDEVLAALEGVTPQASRVPMMSAMTGEYLDGLEAGAQYWYDSLRATVQFSRGVERLGRDGYGVFVEVSPHPVLTAAVTDTLEHAGIASAVVGGTLRREDGGSERLIASMAGFHVRGVKVDWSAVLPAGRHIDLPTYAFQHQRFWPASLAGGLGDVRAAGLNPVGHPLLGAAVELADGDGVILTGRLSIATQPWLAEHTINGTPVFPGTGLIELAAVAGHLVGCTRIDSLDVEAPLVLTDDVQVQVTVGAAGDNSENGVRTLEIFARTMDPALDQNDWTRHATGQVRPVTAPPSAADLAIWPPADAEAVPVDGLYESLAAVGQELGESFQGLDAVWRRGEDVFAEVRLPESAAALGGVFGLHPAVLDAALQAVRLARPADAPLMPLRWDEVCLYAAGATVLHARLRVDAAGVVSLLAVDTAGTPVVSIGGLTLGPVSLAAELSVLRDTLFAVEWKPVTGGETPTDPWAVLGTEGAELVGALAAAGVEVAAHADLTALSAAAGVADSGVSAAGAGAAAVHIAGSGGADAGTGATGVADAAAGNTGVAGSGSGAAGGARSGVAGPGAAAAESGRVSQTAPGLNAGVPASANAAAPAAAVVPAVVVAPLVSADQDQAAAAHALATQALELAQQWLAAEAFEDSRLVILTQGAVAAEAGEDVLSVGASAVWGLVRSAQAENPGRFVLADLPAGASASTLFAALGTTEPELAVRGTQAYARRLVRAASNAADNADTRPRTGGTFLVTGGTGVLAGITARHLAVTGQADRLVLVSRSGARADSAATLAAGIAEAGAEVRIVAADVTDRAAMGQVVASIEELRGVMHTAGIVDDGIISSLTADRLGAVMRPKADAASILHELTADRELDYFVLFSSAAATFGGPGQGNYTAANTFLDGLAAHRRANGLAGQALAWGSWMAGEGIGKHLSQNLLNRANNTGELSTEEGLDLLDEALTRDEAHLVPFRLDVGALRAVAARGGVLPALLHELAPVRAGVATAVNTGGSSGALRQQLAGLRPAERERAAGQLVRTHVAAVLGHASPDAIDPERAFTELGFDSLTAVELRNRLNQATGLKLSATLVFDHPTPKALSKHIVGELTGEQSARSASNISALSDDPIAIVGLGCRFPGGVDSPEAMWRMLSEGTDTISRFPGDRGWDPTLFSADPQSLGTSYADEGGFIERAGDFDPGFFRISPREALAMDPQQRLLLETSWEALEHAGINPDALRGSSTGVFVGAAASGYSALGVAGADGAEGHLLTGNVPSVISGRVSYTLGLEGPAVTVDTACSASLVALHLAAASLRTGESDLALAGGVMVMVDAAEFLSFSQQKALAADGRSKAFSAQADGMGLGEGSGMVVLERLSDARRNGHAVLAVIEGSAMNQDGASNGLTAPNGPSQQRVIRAALAQAGLGPNDVDVVEAHGTGTSLGDPIEAQALLATYGESRPENRPLWLGSVKSNIGHAQQAAGVAGVLKMVLALQHAQLPVTLHADEPSTHIDWSAGDVRLLTQPVVWEPTNDGRPRRAGVSSFGISGTNAHLILAEAPPAPEAAQTPKTSEPKQPSVLNGEGENVTAWLVSGRSPLARSAQAARLAAWVGEAAPEDVAWSLATARATFENRSVVLGSTRDELLTGLAALEAGEPGAALVTGTAAGTDPIVFVFPGQGSQWAGMGRELAAASPVFAARLAECEAALSPHVDWSLAEVLAGAEGAPSLDRVDVVQPALWALNVSLAAVWQAAGVEPDAVVGHSQGEIAAAVVAGILSLEDAAKVVALRSQALTALSGRGGMLSIAEPAEAVQTRIEALGLAGLNATNGRAGGLSIAAVNGPNATVVSGDPALLEALMTAVEADGGRARMLPVDYASHNAQVDSIRERVLELLQGLNPQPARLPMISAMTGQPLTGPEADAGYWFASLRASVQFDRAVQVLRRDGYGVFVEVSAHPVLTNAVAETLEAVGGAKEPIVAGTLRRDEGGARRMLASLAELHVRGVEIDWASVLPRGRRIALPTYAFEHRRFWPSGVGHVADLRSAGLNTVGHPLLSAAVELAEGDGLVLTGRLAISAQPWLADHTVGGTAFFPGTGFVELAVVAGHLVECTRIDELTLAAPLVLPAEGEIQIQVTVSGPTEDGLRAVEIFARLGAGEGWMRHASGRVGPVSTAPDAGDLAIWPPLDASPISVDGLYEAMAAAGQGLGPAFQGLDAVFRRGDDVFAEVTLPSENTGSTGMFGLHPAVLDAALQAIWVANPEDAAQGPRMPFVWSDVSLYAAGATALRARLRRDSTGAVQLLAVDAAGSPVVSVGSLVLRPVSVATPSGPQHLLREVMFGVEWTPVAVSSAPVARCGLLGDDVLGLGGLGTDVVGYPSIDALADVELPPVVLVGLGSTDANQGPAARELAASTLTLLQDWLDRGPEDARLVVVTRGAVAASPAEMVTDLAAAAVWGLVRSAQMENPGRFVLLDLPTETGTAETDNIGAPERPLASLLASALATPEPEIAFRDGQILGRRLVRSFTGAEDESTPEATKTPGAVLITGGTGTLAGLTARHLAATGRAAHLLLVSRSGPAAAKVAERAAAIAEAGADVQVVAADVTERTVVRNLLRALPARHPLTGVVHTAGIVDDGLIGSLTPAKVGAVMRPKTDAAWILHELTAGLGLDLFVMFSSAAASFGSAGQGNYAAGNAFLDALAAHRRAAGLPGLSLAWGAWVASEGIGRNLNQGLLARATGSGTNELSADEGLVVLDHALARDEALLVPFRLDVAGLRAVAAQGGALPSLLQALAPTRRGVATAANTGATATALRDQLSRMPVAERERRLVQLVRDHVAAVLGHGSGSAIEPGRAFSDLGFDSLTAVELRNRLNEATGLRLPATLVFDYPSTAVLAAHLGSELLGVLVDGAASQSVAVSADPAEPIAIVGMGCRFPGGIHDQEGLWELLAEGRDAITGLPTDRGWNLDALFDPDPDKPGTFYTASGGFLHDAGLFDPGFFGISPREAQAMDPQQRLLLEVSWEALERAGIDPVSLRGSQTGVFAGGSSWHYGSTGGGGGAEGHLMTGASTSIISGRVAYTFGLEGPAVTVDTACSSALVAMHLAAQALRAGECSLALAGGVTVMATPGALVGFSRQRGLAADGKCKAFSAEADGMGMAEGAGMILLERLSDARRNGHQVLAVMRGSAINQDGASNGLTAPNGPSQQRVIRAALANARLNADDIDVVEAHGTGTTLGDPIEAQALMATYGRDRAADDPLWLGSVKSNLAHTQSAAGAAGVMKMVLALQHNLLPRSLHADQPAPYVDWSAGTVALLAEERPWKPAEGKVRRAAVSSFGISGTNAHVIIEEAPAQDRPAPADPKPHVLAEGSALLVSSRSTTGLGDQADRLATFVHNSPQATPAELAWSLATTRSTFEHRAVVLGSTRAEILAGLAAVSSGEPSDQAVSGVIPAGGGGGRTVFVFPGQGSQWLGMGRALAAASPVFAARLAECSAALAPFVDWSLDEVLADEEALQRVDVVQPALWAVMVSLAEVWKASGVYPDAVVGHSQGEIAAAVVAGILSLEDAARVVALRSQTLTALSGRGGMLAIAEPVATVEARIADQAGVTVAAVNGPNTTVVSGEPALLEGLAAQVEAEGGRARILPVDYASHGPQVEELREEILTLLAPVTPMAGQTPLVSSMTGETIEGTEADAGYWYASLRNRVRFADAVQFLADGGHNVWIESSPHPVLTTSVEAIAEGAVITGTLRRDEGGPQNLLAALAAVHTQGVRVDWPSVLPQARQIALPTYAFQHEHFWYLGSGGPATDVTSAGLDPVPHPLLGAAVELADDEGLVVTGRLALNEQPWLNVDVTAGTSATVLAELAVVAGFQVGCPRIAELTVTEPIVLPAGEQLQVQVQLGRPEDSGRRSVEIRARRARSEVAWTRHASGVLEPDSPEVHAAVKPVSSGAWPPASAVPLLGTAEGLLKGAWRDGQDILAEVSLGEDTTAAMFGVHPALTAALLEVLSVAGEGWPTAGHSDLLLASAWNGFTVHTPGATTLRARLSRTHSGALSLVAADANGTAVLSVESLTLRPIPAASLHSGAARLHDALFALDWAPVRIPVAASAGRWSVLGTDSINLVSGLAAAGVDVDAHSDLTRLVAATEGQKAPEVVLAVVETPDELDGRLGDGTPQAARETAGNVLLLLQQWLALEGFEESRLVLVSRGAVAVHEGDPVADLPAASVWGLVRSAQSENPDRIVLADLSGSAEQADPDLDVATLAAALSTSEPELAVRDGHAYGRRLIRPAGSTAVLAAGEATGTILITGGTGTLAALVAQHLAATHRAAHLLLVSRRGPSASGAAALAASIALTGVDARIVTCDVTDPDTTSGLLAAVATDPGQAPLIGVVHTAGVLDDGVIGSLTPERIDTVMRPKVDAAWTLHRLTAGLDLRIFALFSSAAATFGSAGQGNYAAGNAFLDALAAHRRSTGRPAVSLAWGLWADASGLTSHLSDGDRERMSRGGVTALTAEEGLALLDVALARDEAVLVPARLNVTALRSQVAQAGTNALVPPLLRVLSGGTDRPVGGAKGTSAAAQALQAQLAGLSPLEADRMLTDLVRTHAAAVLGHAPTDLMEPGRAFREVGFDSLTAVELRNRLAMATGLKLPATLVFDYPAPAVLAAHIRAELSARPAPAAAEAVRGAVFTDEPIAIVGIGCRFPGGANTPERFWELLRSGTDAIAGFPTDRGWDTEGIYDADADTARSSTTMQGGFLYEAPEFDPGFFGISPREALGMDPQQRLLLETSWEALERAGIDPATLRGSNTGVFAGGYGSSWYGIGSDSYGMTGTSGSVISGRVSYTLGLEGPAVTVDTACSSSLVALHLAAQALRAGECTLALAGGATVMFNTGLFSDFSRQGGLASDGRCKAFGADADGTGWGEGAGILLLERLSDAQRNGRQVLAVIAGSAVNQDGASNGITAPNGPAQQRVIRTALASAGLRPADVDAVEAHGTGTVLGDPIEAQALLATYGQDRPEGRPVWLGSVKSNIAHTGAAAGVAGVIKMVLALNHQLLPRTLHAEEPSPHVDWSDGDARILTEARPWPRNGQPRRAGVSAFGISGTNAHVIVEEAPVAVEVPNEIEDERPRLLHEAPVAWVVSARSAPALAAQAGRLAEFAAGSAGVDRAADAVAAGVDLADVAWSLVTTRSQFEHRAVVLGADPVAGARSLSAGTSTGSVVTGSIPAGTVPRVGFLFAGQGAQKAGMGRELYAASPVFAETFDRVVAMLETELGLPVRDVVLADATSGDENADREGLADQTLYAQTGLFAVEVSLVAMLAAAGVTPDVVAGHSVGEIAAAHAAGVLTLEDACRLIANRARLMQALPTGGAMAAVEATEDEVLPTLTDGVSIGAVNGPTAVVVSGDEAAVEQVVAHWQNEGRRTRRLRVSHAFHSARMDPVLDELSAVASGLAHNAPRVAWVGALPGELVSAPEPGYWAEQARQAVRFADSVQAMADLGVTTFIEIGPDGTLSALGQNALPTDESGAPAAADFVPLLRPKTAAGASVLNALARAHVRGVTVDWTAILPRGKKVDLPTYAFSRKHFWAEPGVPSGAPVTAGSGTEAEAQFWAAVESGDLAGLSGALDLDGDRPFSEVLPMLAGWRQRDREEMAVADWRYRIAWSPVADPEPAALSGTWLLVTNAAHRADADEAARALSARGAEPVIAEVPDGEITREGLGALVARVLTEATTQLLPDEVLAANGSLNGSVNTDDAGAGMLDGAGTEQSQPPADLKTALAGVAGVLSFLALNESPLTENPEVSTGLAATVGLIQALGDGRSSSPLWLLTRGGAAAKTDEVPISPAQAQIWGLGRVTAMEHPDRWGGLIDLPASLDERAGARLTAVLARAVPEDAVAIRSTGINGRRLVRARRAAGLKAAELTETPVGEAFAKGTVLVTGGTGAIGMQVAQWLAEQNTAQVTLWSRSGARARGVAELAAKVAESGSTVQVLAGDVAQREHVQALLGWMGEHGPALTGVMHTAGVNDDGVLDRMTPERLGGVLAPKAAGAVHLDELTSDLSAFVLFSSATAIFGGGGQGNYAAANTFLDALAEKRRLRGEVATSLAWGVWAGGGMAEADATVRNRVSRGPLKAMEPEPALRVMGQILTEDQTTAGDFGVMDVDWIQIAQQLGDLTQVPMMRELTDVHALVPASAGPDTNAIAELLQLLSEQTPLEQERFLTDRVRGEVAAVLGHESPDAVEAGASFSDLGFDSLTAVELRNRLSIALARQLPATLVFDYPTPLAVAKYLRSELVPDAAEVTPQDAEEAEVRAVLANVPIGLLRSAGLLQSILELAEPAAERAEPQEEAVSIEEMDVADLIRMARGVDDQF